MPKVYRQEGGALVWLPNATGGPAGSGGQPGVLFGAALTTYPWTADFYADAVDRYVADVGQPGILRAYDGGMPPSNDITQHYEVSEAYDRGFAAVHFSCKMPPVDVASGARDTDIEALVASIPASRRTLLTYWHEPENDDFPASTWKTASTRFASIVRANRGPGQDVLVGPVLMGWTLDPASGRDVGDWLDPGTDAYDFIGWDEFNSASERGDPWDSFEALWAPISGYMDTNQAGTPQVCAETGTHADSSADRQARADWLTAAETYVTGRGDFLAFEYFDSDVGAKGWWLRRWADGTTDWAPDQPSMDTWTAIQGRHR